MRFADLFCGIGGFHFAAAEHGWSPVFASEIDEAAAAQYEAATGYKPHGDICAIEPRDVPDHDLLMGGFPCQSFSIIGERRGLDDVRGQLIYDVARVLRAKQPKAFVLENVKQLATHDGGRTLGVVLDLLEGVGYSVQWKVLNALDYGLPQKRERIFLVGFREGAARKGFLWPAERERASLASILEDTASLPASLMLSDVLRKRFQGQHTPKVSPSIWHQNKGGGVNSHPFSCALRANASYNYLLVDGMRRLSPREMLRLQGFPESFPVVGCYGAIRKQCGNAVPVPMASAVIGEVTNALG